MYIYRERRVYIERVLEQNASATVHEQLVMPLYIFALHYLYVCVYIYILYIYIYYIIYIIYIHLVFFYPYDQIYLFICWFIHFIYLFIIYSYLLVYLLICFNYLFIRQDQLILLVYRPDQPYFKQKQINNTTKFWPTVFFNLLFSVFFFFFFWKNEK